MRISIRSNCDNTVVTTNNAPNFTLPTCTSNIPASTPFELSVTATDANGDAMTYSWEQTDLGAQGAPGIGAVMASAGVGVQDFTCDNSNMETMIVDVSAAMNTGAPTFRSRTPTSTPTRSFPIIEKVVALAPSGNLSNTADRDGEVLPNFARNMTFRLTVRDNKGALTYDDLTVTVNANGPFRVTAPNASTVAAGATTSVTWSTGGFTGCNNVNIRLSTDGGLTYPIILATNQSYATLSATVTIPSSVIATTNARIRVECADGNCATFYNVSGAFTITSSCMAGASNLTIITPQTFTTPPVNLGWSNTGNRIYSTIATSVMATLDGSDPVAPRGIATTEGGTTCTQSGNRAYEVFNFAVDQTGTYTFTQTGTTSFIASSIYTGLNAANPCSSTSFLGSTAWDNGGGSTNYVSIRGFSLTEGIQYSLVINATSGNTATVSFSGPGNVLLPSTDPGAAYSYTYVLVSDADNLIKAVSATADFGASGTFIAGTYKVYGISYLTADAANPNVWVGQSIGGVNGTSCLLQSSNFKALTFSTLLPVELVAFKGEVVKEYNQLSWVTASETDNAGFEVQRAKDAQEWETLAFVKGNGTTLEKQSYKFLDRQPLEGINYYRLKQIDTDETFEYSYIISLDRKADKTNALVLYPNPSSETITFELGGNTLQDYTFQLVDPIGRVLKVWNGLEEQRTLSRWKI
ncbi:MAG: hypothetical protein HC892_12235 [Saprospiraceae bacterium]|nr:hypothetical protein [Saprospiraceae bacterium]